VLNKNILSLNEFREAARLVLPDVCLKKIDEDKIVFPTKHPILP
jgi:hypothetical protein